MVPMRLAGDLSFEEMGEDFDYDFDDVSGLAALRRRLKRRTTIYIRTKYQYLLVGWLHRSSNRSRRTTCARAANLALICETCRQAVQAAFQYEDIVDNQKHAQQGTSNSRWRFRSVGQSLGERWYSQPMEHVLFAWKCVLRTPLLRVLSGALSFFFLHHYIYQMLTQDWFAWGQTSFFGARVSMCDSGREYYLAGSRQSQCHTLRVLPHDCRHP